jgi:hypothetical protein
MRPGRAGPAELRVVVFGKEVDWATGAEDAMERRGVTWHRWYLPIALGGGLLGGSLGLNLGLLDLNRTRRGR